MTRPEFRPVHAAKRAAAALARQIEERGRASRATMLQRQQATWAIFKEF